MVHFHGNMDDAKKEPRKQGKKKDPHAVALGKRGGRKGGVARAKAMAPEERKASAQKAAQARWSVPKATHVGELKIGSLALPCAVLEDGRRVISERGMSDALGRARHGGQFKKKHESDDGVKLPVFLIGSALKPYISLELMMALSNPIIFRSSQGGRPAHGIEATLLPDICEVWLKARAAGALSERQQVIAGNAEVLVRALAKTGIIALVDEVTGYQYDRARDELQIILKAYISEKLMPWTQKFPTDFFQGVYKIYNWEFAEGKAQHPSVIGHFINRYIYKALPPGVLEELQNKNPVTETGRRRHKHFQFLTQDTGHPELDRQILRVTTLLQISADKDDFKAHFKRACPKKGDQFDINFPREEE